MKLIKEYKNEEIPETYIIILMANTIFLAVHFYCSEIFYNNHETFLIISTLVSMFLIGSLITAIFINLFVYLITIFRYSVIKFRKNIDNESENFYLKNVEYMLLVNCALLIINLIIVKTL